MVKKTTKKTPIGTRKTVTRDRVGLMESVLAITVDIGQLGKSVQRSDYAAAKRQQRQIIKSLQKVKL